jgi:nucleotide-binding universal stress UspA family protein
MIKDVVVNLSLGAGHDPALDYALSLAAAFDAHICGVAFEYEPVIPPTFMGGVPTDLIDAQRAENKKLADAALARFEAAAKRSSLSAEHRSFEATLMGAADTFAQIARRFDISVVGQSEPEKASPQEFIIEGALFDSGRPVIVVPYIQREGLKLDRVIVCWDASRTAARAIADALPLLANAKMIDVVTIASKGGKPDELPGVEISQHLARHGLKIDAKHIVAQDVDVANTILSYAADSGADFIVMGGYGHSRLREFVLGGATRGILASMTAPTLMSH